ncbi:MAG: hypothetical protein SynsKO_22910 [Synoicihabitans sp.]
MNLKGLQIDQSFPWIPASVVVAILLLGVIGLIDSSPAFDPLRKPNPDAGGGVILSDLQAEVGEDTVFGELVLKNPTPLFLPTRWNSGQVEARLPAERAPGATFTEISAKPVFAEAVNELQLPDGVSVPQTPISALEKVERLGSSLELSTRDGASRALPRRAGYLEVAATDSGKIIYEKVLEITQERMPLQVPIEAVLVINSVGVWVRPTVVEALEGTAVDFDQINLLVQGQRLETVLGAGIYRILLGP